ncbi:MAG TPA: MarC family protein [Stellaceae bacterium]|nr:MarC family protein [Stellaceae bacterium]
MVKEIANSFLLVYAGLFPIVNPVGSAPVFLGLTRHCTDQERRSLARRVAVNGFFLLLGSLFVGSHVLEFFGITLPVVRVAGGLVVSAFAWKLLHAGEEPGDRRTADAAAEPIAATDVFYPLTMPLTVGPGSISVAITLGSQRPKTAAGLADLALLGAAAIAGLVAIAATVYICYRFAEPIISALGESGTNVLVRLSAFILLCIGIQIIWSGYSALVVVAT